jgi:hypothetical protein
MMFTGRDGGFSIQTERKMTEQRPKIYPPLLLTSTNIDAAKSPGFPKNQPRTARNNTMSAVTSKVSVTEAKLIIALRKDLLIASKLVEKD